MKQAWDKNKLKKASRPSKKEINLITTKKVERLVKKCLSKQGVQYEEIDINSEKNIGNLVLNSCNNSTLDKDLELYSISKIIPSKGVVIVNTKYLYDIINI